MKKLVKILSILIVAIAMTAIGFRACMIKIDPGEVGILNKEWGGGLQEKDFSQGYYLSLGPLHTWIVMDTKVQTLNMLRTSARKKQNRAKRATIHPPLRVKSSDGADVTLDITIKYRIKPKAAWKVFNKFGDGVRYQIQVRSRANKTLQLGLGALKTEEFFDPNRREKTQEDMMKQLAPRLDQMNVELIAILIRDLEFQQSFEAKIKSKTLTKQKAELEKAKTKAAEESGVTNEIRAQTAAKVTVINQTLQKTLAEMTAENNKKIRRLVADYEKYVVETESEADLYAKKKEAEGIKLLKDAEARGQALKRSALSSTGGNMVVALRAVENLEFGTLMISTQLVNPLDFDAMMRRLGAQK